MACGRRCTTAQLGALVHSMLAMVTAEAAAAAAREAAASAAASASAAEYFEHKAGDSDDEVEHRVEDEGDASD